MRRRLRPNLSNLCVVRHLHLHLHVHRHWHAFSLTCTVYVCSQCHTRHRAAQGGAAQRCATKRNAVRCGAVRCSAVRYGTAMHDTTAHCAGTLLRHLDADEMKHRVWPSAGCSGVSIDRPRATRACRDSGWPSSVARRRCGWFADRSAMAMSLRLGRAASRRLLSPSLSR